ncbi:hypothetical protein [Haloarchaeobius baliensis]|uniref:hypothetical protein n=1 Tax=Haloarchaeobius baliensis TaxID=1670458 RepID=UPI003F880897
MLEAKLMYESGTGPSRITVEGEADREALATAGEIYYAEGQNGWLVPTEPESPESRTELFVPTERVYFCSISSTEHDLSEQVGPLLSECSFSVSELTVEMPYDETWVRPESERQEFHYPISYSSRLDHFVCNFTSTDMLEDGTPFQYVQYFPRSRVYSAVHE